MSEQVAAHLEAILERIEFAMREARQLKREHPEARICCWWNAGSILNAYREGDLSCDDREDPVLRAVRDLTAKEVVEWLVKYKGLPESSADNVESNLREQFKWHRLQGRLDHNSTAALIAELWLLRGKVSRLRSPKEMEGAK